MIFITSDAIRTAAPEAEIFHVHVHPTPRHKHSQASRALSFVIKLYCPDGYRSTRPAVGLGHSDTTGYSVKKHMQSLGTLWAGQLLQSGGMIT